jgi:molybdopterin converting factor small subunit
VDLDTSARTLRDVLAALFGIYPGIRDRILTEQGILREHINIFVGNDNVRSRNGLATPVDDGAEIWIIPAISGG